MLNEKCMESGAVYHPYLEEDKTIYLEVCYGNADSICIRATRKLSKADAEYYTIDDAIRLDFEVKHVTRVIELSEEEAFSAFDMERPTPMFEPRFK